MKDHIVVCLFSAQTSVASELPRSHSKKVKAQRMQITNNSKALVFLSGVIYSQFRAGSFVSKATGNLPNWHVLVTSVR